MNETPTTNDNKNLCTGTERNGNSMMFKMWKTAFNVAHVTVWVHV